MSEQEVVILGTGTSMGVPMIGCDCDVCRSADPKNHRMRTGVAVSAPQGWFLIDTPIELRLQLLREGIGRVDAAIYTHSHADHIFGLDDLRIFSRFRDDPFPLYCEEGVEAQLRRSFDYAFIPPPPNAHAGAVPRLRFERISEAPWELLGVNVQPIRLNHGRLPILGFRVGSFAYCTDVSEIPEESWRHLDNLDVLVIDALREKPHPTHFNVTQALEVVERIRPKRTYFTHISHSLEHEATNARLPAGVELAYDGLKLRY